MSLPPSNIRELSDAPGKRPGLTLELGGAVLQLARRIRQERSDEAITLSEFSVLALLDRHGPTTPTRLAEHEQIQPPSMTRTLANLIQKGYVTKSEHPTDRRQVLVVLTNPGKTIVKETRRRRDAWLARRLTRLEPEQRAVLADAARIMRTMTTQK